MRVFIMDACKYRVRARGYAGMHGCFHPLYAGMRVCGYARTPSSRWLPARTCECDCEYPYACLQVSASVCVCARVCACECELASASLRVLQATRICKCARWYVCVLVCLRAGGDLRRMCLCAPARFRVRMCASTVDVARQVLGARRKEQCAL